MKPKSLSQLGGLVAFLAATLIVVWGLLHALGMATAPAPEWLAEPLIYAGLALFGLGMERRLRELFGSTREIRAERTRPPESGPGPLT